tara:strand:+ start:2849 stop:3133 length:285 start_codon:yes stop_codon:yes gene_type:complete
MGAKTTMEVRGHHICSLTNYEVRQRIVKPTIRKVGNKEVPSSGSVEVMVYKGKKKIEGGLKDVKLAAQKIYDILKSESRESTVSKKNIKKYNLV